ncbi:hypothetical protein [Halalkalibacter hemicellulosilyticus]|uniref:Uncharacterized protein n=1 Tax=Halalkalibacter hemicellulosilyticusJCM 9152 TaxID=1236971 RepID=W4QMD9_9BACI|nr:hypothetical protein [Halalkalibacter hemicellulosilyticus]GAE32813.1 hypothetical protein JCM9152_4383 [Halalkalibacter hemicellulosilyticusJCM 9152]
MKEKRFVSKQKRIEAYSSQVERIMDEINKRDLAEVPSEKLFDTLLKYLELLKKEEQDISFYEKNDDIHQMLDSNFNQTYEWKA